METAEWAAMRLLILSKSVFMVLRQVAIRQKKPTTVAAIFIETIWAAFLRLTTSRETLYQW
jgi:hypothetical protein